MGSAWAEPLFEAIFSEHYARVVAVLGRLLGDHAEAEEAAMDVFCKLYEQPLPQERDHNLGGWLYRTATRLGIDRLRAANRRKQYERTAGRDLAEASAPSDPLQDALREETCRQV